MKNRDIYLRRHKIQESLYIGQWHLSPLQNSYLGPHMVLPIAIGCPIIFSWISTMVWNLFPFTSNFSFGKKQKSQGIKSGLWRGLVIWTNWCFAKNSAQNKTAWAGMLSWWSCQSPVAHSCGLFWTIWRVSAEECSSLMQNLMQIHCSTGAAILNVMAT